MVATNGVEVTQTAAIQPMYDVNRTYEENYRNGPFGDFAQVLERSADAQLTQATSARGCNVTPTQFLGSTLRLPFGIPAGPLLNAKFTTAAFRMGFDMAVYKTVRSRFWPCNPFPNVLSVHPSSSDGFLDPLGDELQRGVRADEHYRRPVSISNSFGVPSRDPDEWQPDMQAAIQQASPGQLLIPSFQGSRVEGMDTDDYVADHVRTAELVAETGASLMEMNTSCPNEGLGSLLCDDPHLVARITEEVKSRIGDMPLIIKLGYIHTETALETMVRENVGRGTVQGFTAINTIPARLVNAQGAQALPGAGGESSGVCGHAIRQAGLDMVRRLGALRTREGLDYVITGVGGVASYDDYREYRQAGADTVMSATGAMFNPRLARQIAEGVERYSD